MVYQGFYPFICLLKVLSFHLILCNMSSERSSFTKRVVARLVKKFIAFYETGCPSSIFSRALH
jgi:hypothetical protein